MSEETKDASRTIPLVVVWAVAANAAMLLIVGITFIFCLGDLESVLNSPTGQPMIQVFYNATQSVAGTSVMVAVVIVIFMSACVGQVATSSRQMWSFARDQGEASLPKGFLIAKTDDLSRIPRLLPSPESASWMEYSDQRYYCLCYYHFATFSH